MEKLKDRIKAGFVVIMIFIAGFFSGIGAVATFLYVKGPPPSQFLNTKGLPAPFFKDSALRMNMLTDKLDLRQDQQDGIRRIIEQTKKELSDLRRSNRPKVRMVIERAEREIRGKLTAEQEKKFDVIVERKKQRAKKFKKRERIDRR